MCSKLYLQQCRNCPSAVLHKHIFLLIFDGGGGNDNELVGFGFTRDHINTKDGDDDDDDDDWGLHKSRAMNEGTRQDTI